MVPVTTNSFGPSYMAFSYSVWRFVSSSLFILVQDPGHVIGECSTQFGSILLEGLDSRCRMGNDQPFLSIVDK